MKYNRKVIVHAFNEAEAMKVINAAKKLIIPEYVNGGYLSKSCMVLTKEPLAEIDVKPRLAKYFPRGRKSDKPEWIAKF